MRAGQAPEQLGKISDVHLPEIDERVDVVCPRFPNARLPARVRGINGAVIVISVPMMGGEPLKLAAGEKISLRWRDESLLLVVARKFSHGGLLVELEVVEYLARQRRGYFRWAMAIPIRFCLVNDDEPEKWHQTQTSDLSGGGLSFAWNVALEVNSELKLEITLDRKTLPAQARVVATRPHPGKSNAYIVAVEFQHIAEADRSRIIRYIFRRQHSAHSGAARR